MAGDEVVGCNAMDVFYFILLIVTWLFYVMYVRVVLLVKSAVKILQKNKPGKEMK